MLQIKEKVTYWGMVGKRQVERRVNIIETRSSGTQYVNWTHVKKDGSEGERSWTERRKFTEWAMGIYELPSEQV